MARVVGLQESRSRREMNGKLILQLSLFGLAMGLATVFLIPSSVEPIRWFLVFVICAYVIGKRAPKLYFLHGFLLGLANSVWVTASHIVFVDRYLTTHAREAAMMASSPNFGSPRLMMLVVGPIAGIISGVVIGVLAWIAGKIFSQRATG
jgi:hypothetical protein